jgi:hypothetical protein
VSNGSERRDKRGNMSESRNASVAREDVDVDVDVMRMALRRQYALWG